MEIIGASRLRPDARKFEATERLHIDERASDAPIDVKVADEKLFPDPVNGPGIS